jgi:hypothetical protein
LCIYTQFIGKQKINQTNFEMDEMIPMIGIVTNGKTWVFIRQTGPIESAKLEKSEEFDCSFTGDMVNEVISYVVRLLQALLHVKQQESKRSCTV